VETDVAALVELLSGMDDLVIQFDDTEAGSRFIEAWKRARMILYSGGGHGGNGTPAAPVAPAEAAAPLTAAMA
jgi:hypothetical protein